MDGLTSRCDEPLLVGHLERRGDLGGDPRRPCRLQRPVAVDQGAELGAVDPSRDDVDGPALLAGLVQRNDVGVVERRQRPGLPAQTLADDRFARHLGLHELEGDGSVEPQLAGSVEDPDPARADDALDLVAGDGGTGREH